MKNLKKNLVSRGFTILALFILFFILPVNRAKAACDPAVQSCAPVDYYYYSEDTLTNCYCHSLQAGSQAEAEDKLAGLTPIPRKCGVDQAVPSESSETIPEVTEGACPAEDGSTQLIYYYCIVIEVIDDESSGSSQLSQGKCLDFTSTNDSNAFDQARTLCAGGTTKLIANTVQWDKGRCQLQGELGSEDKPKGSLAELKRYAKSLNKAKFSGPVDVISRFINMLLAFIGSISLVLYIFAGFLWMTASGNAEKVTKAKSIMVWTTLGVVVMLASYMLVSFIFDSLKL